ncbi:MAG: hypothetical protein KAU02_05515, partial [Tenericutes bacterium]|nr:hypothetical protein [Mycoplasmatota bacterium]
MSSVKQFQKLLNRNDNQRFTGWKAYRKKITNHIISIIKKHNINSCMLFGVGNSDDIDLSSLLEYIPDIVISDIDTQALKNASKKYNLKANNYSMISIDYLGLDNCEDWNNFVTNIVKLNKRDL